MRQSSLAGLALGGRVTPVFQRQLIVPGWWRSCLFELSRYQPNMSTSKLVCRCLLRMVCNVHKLLDLPLRFRFSASTQVTQKRTHTQVILKHRRVQRYYQTCTSIPQICCENVALVRDMCGLNRSHLRATRLPAILGANVPRIVELLKLRVASARRYQPMILSSVHQSWQRLKENVGLHISTIGVSRIRCCLEILELFYSEGDCIIMGVVSDTRTGIWVTGTGVLWFKLKFKFGSASALTSKQS